MVSEPTLTPKTILEQLNKNGVTHLVWLPDSETNFMYNQMSDDPGLQIVPVCREGESLPIAAGLWIGGKKPVVLIQNTGMFESGDSIRGMGLDIDFPIVMMIGYRGYTRHGVTNDSAGRFTERILNAWNIDYFLVETDAEADRISVAFDRAAETQRPVACLMGAEYSQ